MSILDTLRSVKKKEILMVGEEGSIAEKKSTQPLSQVFYMGSMITFVLAIFFSFSSSGSLIDEKKIQLRNYHQSIEQKKTEQINLEALQALASQVESIREDHIFVAQAVPEDPHYDQVMAYLEHVIKKIRKSHYVQIPESVSWKIVSENDISNSDFLDMEVMQYAFSFVGEYEGFIEFLKALRSNLRLMDIREIRNFLQEKDMVTADLTFWAYSLL